MRDDFRKKQLFVVSLFLQIVCADISIYTPESLKNAIKRNHNENKIPISIANFGLPPYGKTIIGNVYLSKNDDSSNCNSFEPFDFDTDQLASSMLLLDLSHCSNTLQAKHAQEIGMKCLILINDNDRDISLVNFNDDGLGTEVTIPTIVITKQDGDTIKQELLKKSHVEISIEFELKKSFKFVFWDLYMSSDNLKVLNFLRNFYPSASSFDFELVLFRPNYVHWHCSQCQDLGYTEFNDNCLAGGRYCASDPDGLGPILGKHVVEEDLREICLYRSVKSTNEFQL